jgi:hypothetical protein
VFPSAPVSDMLSSILFAVSFPILGFLVVVIASVIEELNSRVIDYSFVAVQLTLGSRVLFTSTSVPYSEPKRWPSFRIDSLRHNHRSLASVSCWPRSEQVC